MKISSKWIIAIWSFIGLVLATQYNACSQQVMFSQSASSLRDEMLSGAVILINGDAKYTNDTQVEVELQDDLATEMYVTNDRTCNSGGTWEPMQSKRAWTLGASNQQVAVYVRFRNSSEGVSTDCLSDTIIHDDQKPSVLLNEPNIITNVNAPIFNFLAWDSISGVKKTSCQWPNQSSAVACDFSSTNGNLMEGVYNVNVVAEDNAGNVGDPITQNLIVDRTPPRVILNSAPAALTALPDAGFAFTGEDNLSGVKGYECSKENDTSFAACTSPLTWTVNDGPHKLFIRATDKAGNVSAVVESDFTLDRSAPTVRILSGPNDFSNSAGGTFTFEGSDNGAPISQFKCRVDSGAVAACTSPYNFSGLKDGSHTFYVSAVDGAGNMSAEASRTWVIDTVAPVVALTQKPAAVTNSGAAEFHYTITDAGSGVSGAKCAIDAGALASCDVAAFSASSLAEGNHTFKVVGLDKAGNQSAPATYSWMVDTSPPTLVLNSGPSTYSNSATQKFTYTASDARSGVNRVECRLDAAVYAPCDSVSSDTVTGLSEGARKMSLRAVDNAGNFSSEVVVNWTVDLIGPVISYFQQPQATLLSSQTQTLGFSVSDASSGVKSVVCALNGQAVACSSGATLQYPNQTAGAYSFVVTAVDNAGNQTVNTKTWQVTAPILHAQDIDVQVHNKVDVVVIIDNSGSMATEMRTMGASFNQFLNQLKGLDWQVGIVTTDTRTSVGGKTDAPKADGRLVELVGLSGQYILNSQMNFASANTIFQNTIQMSTDGSGSERGILAAKRAIQRAFDGKSVNAANAAMFRADAVLAFVVVSDAYDDISQPQELIDEVAAHWNGQKVFTFHSLVIPQNAFTKPTASKVDPADPCANYRESVQYDGRIYYALSDLTGGIKGTECSLDYGTQLSEMGQATVDLVTAATLKCQPVDGNGDGVVDSKDVQITTEGGKTFTSFQLNGNKLTFTSALPGGVNTVKYYCAQ